MIIGDLERLCRRGVVTALDLHFARFMMQLNGRKNQALFLAAALTSRATGEGHVCCDLKSLAGKELLPAEGGEEAIVCPDADLWIDLLQTTSVVGFPGDFRPLILDGSGRLYLYRYWKYESDLAEFIRGRSTAKADDIDDGLLKKGLQRYFPSNGGVSPDLQMIAAITAVEKKLCVVSGGPGTGKTTTVVKILALLLEQAGNNRLRIALAAPTGKAAARLQESIVAAREKLNIPGPVKCEMPHAASTLHRLLGPVSESPYFEHNAGNPLPVDVVVVDEASMVDLALMAKLAQALLPEARLILLGDKDQLASVEAGSILGDICDAGNIHYFYGCVGKAPDLRNLGKTSSDALVNDRRCSGTVADCIVELSVSYRFGLDSGIHAVSRAIRNGDGQAALALLRNLDKKDVQWGELPRPESLVDALRETVMQNFSGYLKAATFEEMVAAFSRFRILCALRNGPYGVVTINGLVEEILRRAGQIGLGRWYRGRPIMITVNDYTLKLYNGDIGFILPDIYSDATPDDESAGTELQGGLYAFFPSNDGFPRKLPLARLPDHETVYAMTVHKSQGSEFDHALVMLSDRESPVLTRELLYTGVTRARNSVSVWGREAVFLSSVAALIHRSSGLRDAIWKT